MLITSMRLKARLFGKSPLLPYSTTKFGQAFFKGFSLVTLALVIFAGTVLLDFHLDTADTLSAQSIEIPSQADWTDHGAVISPGPPGSWDVRLTGAVSPCAVIELDGTYFLYYIGADGNRADDGDARHRALGVATSSDGISYIKHSGNPIITYLPTNDEEEGVFTCGATLDDGGDVILYYGAMTSFAPSQVNDDVRVASSSNGFDFIDLPGNPVIDHDDSSVWGWGDELDPLGAFERNGAWYVYYSVGNGFDFNGNTLIWELGIASGPAPNDLPNTGPALTGGDDIRGGADPIWLSSDEMALFIVRRDSSGQFYIEARVVDPDAPDDLSAPVQTYDFDGFTHATVYLDEQAGKWFMYYLTDSGQINVKTAPAGGGTGGDATQPSAPANLSASPVSHSQIDLSWSAASDPESGISSYTIYRDGADIGSSTGTSFSDTGLTENTTYSYEVSATNGAGLEGPKTSAVTATTPGEPGDTGGSGSLIANLTVASGKSYVVVENGISSGEAVYIDRLYTFTSVPQAMEGATYIRTANSDKSRTEADFLSFTLTQDARVYVAYDTRASQLPQWLSGWTDNGEILGTTDIVNRRVFFRDFAAGEVVLGGNLAAGASGPESKYTVVVTPAGG